MYIRPFKEIKTCCLQVFRSGNILLHQPSNSNYCVSLRQLAVALTIMVGLQKNKVSNFSIYKQKIKKVYEYQIVKNIILHKL